MRNFNKRTNTLLYKNIYLTLYSFACVWEMSWRLGQTAILTQVLLTIAALLSFILSGVDQAWVTEGPKPSICRWLSLWHFFSNWQEAILLSQAHVLPLFFRLFTQVHLLIDGSVEGQYKKSNYLINRGNPLKRVPLLKLYFQLFSYVENIDLSNVFCCSIYVQVHLIYWQNIFMEAVAKEYTDCIYVKG